MGAIFHVPVEIDVPMETLPGRFGRIASSRSAGPADNRPPNFATSIVTSTAMKPAAAARGAGGDPGNDVHHPGYGSHRIAQCRDDGEHLSVRADAAREARMTRVFAVSNAHVSRIPPGHHESNDARPCWPSRSPFPAEHSMLRFLEPPGTCTDALWTRLFDGSYDKPFIVDSKLKRFLHFDLDAVQSAMDLRQPDRLCLAYTRKMMAFLLFNRAPKRILLLGLGGGSLAKFCYRHLPTAAFTAVEVNDHVLALRDEFCVPADDERFRVIHGDGASYVEHEAAGQGRDSGGRVQSHRRSRRSSMGWISIGTPTARSRRAGCSSRTCAATCTTGLPTSCGSGQAFGDDYLILPVRRDGNVIVIAFKEARARPALADILATAFDLKRTFGLDFPRYVHRHRRRAAAAAQRTEGLQVTENPGATQAGLRNRNLAAVPLDHAFHDGEPQPVARFSPRRIVVELHERVEHALAVRRRDAGAVVVDAQVVDAIRPNEERHPDVAARITDRVVNAGSARRSP